MKKTIPFIILITFATLPSSVFAQREQGQGGWGRNCSYCLQFDVNNVMTYSGEIIEVEKFVPGKGMGNGLEFIIKTESGEKKIHVGPVWYVNQQEMKLAIGDEVVVRGSEFDFNDDMVIMASEIMKEKEKMILRDDAGKPMWWQ